MRDANGNYGPLSSMMKCPYASIFSCKTSLDGQTEWASMNDDDRIDHIISSKGFVCNERINGTFLKFEITIQPPTCVTRVNFSSLVWHLIGLDVRGRNTFVIDTKLNEELYTPNETYRIIGRSEMITESQGGSIFVYPEYGLWVNLDGGKVSSLGEKIKEMDKDFTFQFSSGNKKEIHSVVLFACSEFFCKREIHKTLKLTQNCYEVPERFSEKAWELALEFCYHSCWPVDILEDLTVLQELVELADCYLIKDLQIYCLRKLSHAIRSGGFKLVSPYLISTLQCYTFFKEHHDENIKCILNELKANVLEHIRKHFTELVKYPNFLSEYHYFLEASGEAHWGKDVKNLEIRGHVFGEKLENRDTLSQSRWKRQRTLDLETFEPRQISDVGAVTPISDEVSEFALSI